LFPSELRKEMCQKEGIQKRMHIIKYLCKGNLIKGQTAIKEVLALTAELRIFTQFKLLD
jgi:hypothetical protein